MPALEAKAGGGGGCYEPLTEANGTVVAMRDFCFRPAILYVPRGGTVTWVNRDEAPHVVIGANDIFGRYREYNRGETTSFTFRKPGVYPYLCSYHPGMAGALVVGNVRPPVATVERLIRPGSATGVEPSGPAPVQPSVQAQIATSNQQAVPSTGPWKATAGIAFGLLLLTLVAARTRRTRTP
jgi:plastocyanin